MSSGGRETLAQRVANTRARQAAGAPHATPSAPVTGAFPAMSTSAPPALKHAWYEGPYGRQPALLLKWRNIQGRYDGLICVAAPDGDGWALVEMWVDSAMLSPA